MKNQNDLIVSAVSVVIGLILAIVFYATKPDVVAPASPATVDISPPKLPAGTVQYADSLPGASSSGGGQSGRGGPPGMGGRGPGGMGRMRGGG